MSDSPFQAPDPAYLNGLLSHYDVESFIAQGGMGAVYKARQRSLDRDVAIKILPRELGEDAEFRESFATEARAMARLNHPNLIGVFDSGSVEGMPYIVMEYVHGCSLHHSAWNQAIEPAQAVAIVKGICDGLSHAHDHGIIHRDIKPANILLTPKAEPKIGDFGLAHAADSDQPGLVMGTPGYTAPEVFQDPDQAGPLADIYSVGVILHQLLTGIDPAGSEGPPTHPTGNLRLDAIWRKATDVNPARRYPTVAALAADLGKWAAAKPGVAVTAGAAPYRTPGRPAVQPAPGGGGSVTVKLLVAAVLVVAVVFAFQLLQEPKPNPGQGIASHPGTGSPGVADPAPVPEPKPDPAPRPPEPVDLTPEPDPEPVGIGGREEPDPLPVVQIEPEPEPEPVEDLPPGDPDLRARAIGLIGDARKKRDQALAENARDFLFQLGVRARSAESGEAGLIELLKQNTIDHRVPVPDTTETLPAELAKTFEGARAKEQLIDERHLSDLTRIRDAYVKRLAGAAEETTDDELKRRLLAQAERAGDLNAWIERLAPEPERVARTVSVSAGGFAGTWNLHAYNEIKPWIARPDGRLEVERKEWEGTWEILEDGTLEVRFEGKSPFRFTRDGDGWSGKNPFGGRASLSRVES